MKKQLGMLGAVCFLVAGAGFTVPSTATAQSNVTPPPPILVIHREFVKPSDIGSAHEQSESALAQAMAQTKALDHYSGWVSLTGKMRVLFISGFDSMADYQKAVEGMDLGQGASGQAYDRLQREDGKLLTQMGGAVFRYQPDMSVNAPVDIARMRFMDITAIRIKPGHGADWNKLVKLHNDIFGSIPGEHWAMFAASYGAESGLYLAISPMKSLAEIDALHEASKKAWAGVSADQKQQIMALEQSTFKSITSNLYAVDPKMSYVGDKWKAEDPGFWKQ